jgi:predicted RNA binding protein YcfA (HicA-like mRNA interferase family)
MGFATTAKELKAFLRSKGYKEVTGGGRHGVKMIKGGNRIPIPAHSGDLKTNTAKNILGQAGYVVDDLIDWRR